MKSAENFTSITGKGVVGQVSGKKIALGNKALMNDFGIDIEHLISKAEELRAEGQTVMFVAVGRSPQFFVRGNLESCCIKQLT